MQKITTFLWFEDQAEEAVDLYTSVFGDSRVVDVQRYGRSGPGTPGAVMTIDFELAGQRFTALNGGPHHRFNQAISLAVDCVDQREVDEVWARLTDGGGQEGPCGWLTDRFGLSWQVVPRRLRELLSDPDPARSDRVMQAMLGMKKIDVAGLEDAAAG
jgi:predicted 3-demethylubiquinone-9 3-methyltransferase (glyoxalase superfamily)